MKIQEIIILLIGLCTLLIIGVKVYHYFRQKSCKTSVCGGCTGCAMKELNKLKKIAD